MRQTAGLTHFSSVFDAIFTPFHRNYVVLLQPENEELIETN